MMTQKELNALTSTIYMGKLMANNGKLDDDDKKMMTAIQNQTQKVIALTSTITLTKMLNLTGMNLNSRS